MGRELMLRGAIVDSWLEPSRSKSEGGRLVLQVATRERPSELMIVEADSSLVPDRGWLIDLGENMCHGSPVAAVGRLDLAGQLLATHLVFER
jgi:hypothetical protein